MGLKKCEEIMIACFKIAGEMPEFKFPPPTFKKIGPFMKKSVGFFIILELLVCVWYYLTI